jgi:hypothetical protein
MFYARIGKRNISCVQNLQGQNDELLLELEDGRGNIDTRAFVLWLKELACPIPPLDLLQKLLRA